MAYHFPLPGHTKPEVGALYKRWSGEWGPPWRLKSVNPVSGICKLSQENWGTTIYATVGDLQSWHLVRRPTDNP